MYTKLQLVNACLRGIGNEQVHDLEFPDVDTDIAITTVEETMIEVLSQGWWFNIEVNWSLSVDTNGQIAVPNGVIDFRTSGLNRAVDLVKRNGLFYDTVAHTFNLTDSASQDGSICFEFLMNLDVEDMPTVAQQYTRQRAKTIFLTDLEADSVKIDRSSREELRYLALLERQHIRNSKFNVYQHSGLIKVLGAMNSVNSFSGIGLVSPLGIRED